MKQKIFAMTDRFVIKNQAEEDVGFIDARMFSIGHKLLFTDVLGNEVARIQQKIMAWGPTYEIYRNDQLVGVVKKKLFKLYPTFTVDVDGPDDLTVEGELWEHEYIFVRAGAAVASVSKQWWTVADTYGVEVLDSEDHVLILASTLVIDLVHHDEE
jgi:uncharacterized protein YxjI